MRDKIQKALAHTVSEIHFSKALSHHSGKVRESFVLDSDRRAIVVTDRISAFDFILGTVPFKGQVLNQIAAWWFRSLDGIVPHHLLSVPDPNVSIVRNATILPVEIIVRGYLTGTTKTSSWYAYQYLDRKICGLTMPAGMRKNDPFARPIITPTTKGGQSSISNLQSSKKERENNLQSSIFNFQSTKKTSKKEEINMHDEPISREEIVSRGLMSSRLWEQVEDFALRMFAHGQKLAAERKLILVDTKYEMGVDADGKLLVCDEVHTPDSSRYWVGNNLQSSISNLQSQKHNSSCHPELVSGSQSRQSLDTELAPLLGSDGEPVGLDKEFVRREIVARGYDVNNPKQDPAQFLDDELRMSAAERYIQLYERMTGESFVFPKNLNAGERIETALSNV